MCVSCRAFLPPGPFYSGPQARLRRILKTSENNARRGKWDTKSRRQMLDAVEGYCQVEAEPGRLGR